MIKFYAEKHIFPKSIRLDLYNESSAKTWRIAESYDPAVIYEIPLEKAKEIRDYLDQIIKEEEDSILSK